MATSTQFFSIQNTYNNFIKKSEIQKAIEDNNLDFFLHTAEVKCEKIRNTIIDSKLQTLNSLFKETNNSYSPFLILLETIDKYTYKIIYNHHNIEKTIKFTPTTKNRKGKSEASLKKYKQEDNNELSEFIFSTILDLIPELRYAAHLQTIINQGSNDIDKILSEISSKNIVDGKLILNLINDESIILAFHHAPLETFTKIYANKKQSLTLYNHKTTLNIKLGNLPSGFAIRKGKIEPLQKNSSPKLTPLKFANFSLCLKYQELLQELKNTHYNISSLPDLARTILKEYLNTKDSQMFAFKRCKQIFNIFKIRGGLKYNNCLGYITDSHYQLVEYDFKNAYPTIAKIIDFNHLIEQAFKNTLINNLTFLDSKDPKKLNKKVTEFKQLAKKLRKNLLTTTNIKNILGLIEIKGKLFDKSQNETLEGTFVIPIPEFIRILSTNLDPSFNVISLVYYSNTLKTNTNFLNNTIIEKLKNKKLVQNTLIGLTRHYSPFIFAQITSIMRLLLQSTINYLESKNTLILQTNTDSLIFAYQKDEILPNFDSPLEFILKKQFKSCYNHNKTNLITQTYKNDFSKETTLESKVISNDILQNITNKKINFKLLKNVIQKKFHIKQDLKSYFKVKNQHTQTNLNTKKLLIPYFVLEDKQLLTDGFDTTTYAYLDKFRQTADLTANRNTYYTQNLLNLGKIGTNILKNTRKDIDYLKKLNLETLAPEDLPIRKFSSTLAFPFRFIKIIEPSLEAFTYCSQLELDTLKSQIFRKELLTLLKKSILKKDINLDVITLDSHLYINFLKKLMKRASILSANKTTIKLLNPKIDTIPKQFSSSWIIYSEPYQSKNWNSKMNLQFIVGRESVLRIDFRINPLSSRGINLMLFPISYKEIINNSLSIDIMLLLLEKAKDSLEFFSRKQSTTVKESHQEQKKAYKILNVGLTYQAIVNALKYNSINVIGSIGFSTQHYALPESKEELQLLTQQIKYQKEKLLHSIRKELKIAVNKKLKVHEHLQSAGFTINNLGKTAFSCYLKNQEWCDNKNARICKSRNINPLYIKSEKILEEIIRLEYTIWGEKDILAFSEKNLLNIQKLIKNYLPSLTDFAQTFKEIKSLHTKKFTQLLDLTLKDFINEIISDIKTKNNGKEPENPHNYLYPPPIT